MGEKLYFSTALTDILLRLNCPLLKDELTPGNIVTAHRSNIKCLNDDEESGKASMLSSFHIRRKLLRLIVQPLNIKLN